MAFSLESSMKIIPLLALLLSASLYANEEISTSEQAQSLARAKQLSQQCLGCHGEFGIAPITTNPNLAGQNAEYLEYALKAYRGGERKGGMAVIMRANASALSDQDIKDLALYFSSQAGRNASSHQ